KLKNITDAVGAGSTSGIDVAAPNCIINDLFAQNFSTGAQANPSIPRVVSFEGAATSGIMTGMRGQNVNVIAVVAAAKVSIFDTVVNGAASDGFYCLSGSTGITL